MSLDSDIQKAIFNTFDLDPKSSRARVIEKTDQIHGLTELYNMLYQERMLPKLVMEALQQIIVSIALKEPKSSVERVFCDQIHELIDKPLYASEQASGLRF